MIASTHSTVGGIFQILFIFLFLVVGAFVSLKQSRVRRQRVLELNELATRMAFDSFNPDSDETFTLGWGFLGWLDQGSRRYAFNLLQGKYHESPLFVFDYHFQTGEGKNKNERYLTILMLVCKEAFPKLTIGPERLRDRIAESLGLENDIHFESAEFSRTFNVRSPDKKFAYDVCNAQMIEFLLANRDLQVEIQGPVILLAFEPQLPVGKIEFNLQRLAQIRSLLPDYLFTNA
ncbi:MAG TPA: hypothetical protein VK832_16395 [Burkholderiaceae bacterium]|nr:hypothetical protein [Burkholderiaceae bacterium]